MSKKKDHHEEHVDETWLLPYSDLLTLLLALFIVMFAMSKIDQQKFENFSEQFNVLFSSESGVLENGNRIIVPPQDIGPQPSALTENKTAIEEDMMIHIKESIEKEVEKSGHSDDINVTLNSIGLEISLQEVVLFHSGDAEIIKDVYPLLLHMSKILEDLGNTITIAGHTDNIPISTAKFRSNWDLSAMRAINVLNFLVDEGGLSADKLSVQGYGQYSPKYDNSTEDGRTKNRRVEIFIMRKYPMPTDAPS